MKKLLLRVKLFFMGLFGNIDKFLTENVDEAILMVNAIKRVVDSGVVHGITAITPTQLDDTIVNKANGYLDQAIITLDLAKQCTGMGTQELRLKCMLQKLLELSPNVRSALYLKIASLYAKAKAAAEKTAKTAQKISTSDVDTLVQLRYKDIKL